MLPSSLPDLPAPRPRADRRTLVAIVRRELALRHRGALLGMLWPLLDPLLLVGAYALVLGGILEVGNPGQVGPLASGVLPWAFLAATLSGSATSLTSAASMLRSLHVEPGYFALAPGLVNLPGFLAGVLLVGLFQGASPLWLLVVTGLHLATVFPLALLLALACLRIPDLAPALAPALRLGFFATPVLYPLERVTGTASLVLAANPLAPLFGLWQVVLGRGLPPDPGLLAGATGIATLASLAAAVSYRRRARQVAALA